MYGMFNLAHWFEFGLMVCEIFCKFSMSLFYIKNGSLPIGTKERSHFFFR